MVQVPASLSADAEREELKVALDSLERTPRLARLLQFLGEKYLQGRIDEITEFSIATEVFGRPKASFNGTTDSIARVEAHRLRKKLKEYYEKEGRDHAIQISLSYRSYVPEFNRRAVSEDAPAIPEPQADTREREDLPSQAVVDTVVVRSTPDAGTATTSPARHSISRSRILVYSVAAIAVLLLVSFGAVRVNAPYRSAHLLGKMSAPWPNTNQSQTPANPVHVPIRLLAGYEGNPRVDSAGEYWESDRYYQGGAAFQRSNIPVARTSDSMLFGHGRVGDFTYDIPLAPGPYELHLFFVTQETADPVYQTFHILINNKPVLQGFDISSDALGSNVADERVFRDVYPDIDGHLRLGFFGDRSSALLNAIEILPGQPHRQLPVRLVMQREAVTDHNGNFWHPDNYFLGGWTSAISRQVEGTLDPSIYAQERWGHFTYSIPVDTRDRYTFVLHFAELYWGPKASGQGGTGGRVFRVLCNGSTLLDNFDIYKEADSLHALTKTFYHLRPNQEGKLDLTFEPIVNYATVSAIEVIDESE